VTAEPSESLKDPIPTSSSCHSEVSSSRRSPDHIIASIPISRGVDSIRFQGSLSFTISVLLYLSFAIIAVKSGAFIVFSVQLASSPLPQEAQSLVMRSANGNTSLITIGLLMLQMSQAQLHAVSMRRVLGAVTSTDASSVVWPCCPSLRKPNLCR